MLLHQVNTVHSLHQESQTHFRHWAANVRFLAWECYNRWPLTGNQMTLSDNSSTSVNAFWHVYDNRQIEYSRLLRLKFCTLRLNTASQHVVTRAAPCVDVFLCISMLVCLCHARTIYCTQLPAGRSVTCTRGGVRQLYYAYITLEKGGPCGAHASYRMWVLRPLP